MSGVDAIWLLTIVAVEPKIGSQNQRIEGELLPRVLPFWGQDHQSWRLDSGDDSTKVVTAHCPGDAKLRQEDQKFGG